jgi:hypothetical protein
MIRLKLELFFGVGLTDSAKAEATFFGGALTDSAKAEATLLNLG